jgi:hypothetical protein
VACRQCAAHAAQRSGGFGAVVRAVPLAPAETQDARRTEVDEIVCLAQPSPFHATGLAAPGKPQGREAMPCLPCMELARRNVTMRPEPVSKIFSPSPPIYLLRGPFPEFHHLVLRHHLRMERERAGEDGLAPLPGPAQAVPASSSGPAWQDYQLVEDE